MQEDVKFSVFQFTREFYKRLQQVGFVKNDKFNVFYAFQKLEFCFTNNPSEFGIREVISKCSDHRQCMAAIAKS